MVMCGCERLLQYSMLNGQNNLRTSRREASDIHYDRSSTQGRHIAGEADVRKQCAAPFLLAFIESIDKVFKSTSHSVATAQSVAKASHADVNDGASELIEYHRMAEYLKDEEDRLSVGPLGFLVRRN